MINDETGQIVDLEKLRKYAHARGTFLLLCEQVQAQIEGMLADEELMSHLDEKVSLRPMLPTRALEVFLGNLLGPPLHFLQLSGVSRACAWEHLLKPVFDETWEMVREDSKPKPTDDPIDPYCG